MVTKVPLQLSGLDLREQGAYERIDPGLDDLFFEGTGGLTLAVVYTDDPDPVAVALDAARRVRKVMDGVAVLRAFDELVSTGDIAARCAVAPEAVRLWAAGRRRAHVRPFPLPRQVVGTGSGNRLMSLYAWREVLGWVRDVIGVDPDEGVTYLNDAQVTALDAQLCVVPRVEMPTWSDAMSRHFPASFRRNLEESGAAVVSTRARFLDLEIADTLNLLSSSMQVKTYSISASTSQRHGVRR
jgi:hypothetical protein